MVYSLKQAIALANKIDTKYSDKKITKVAGNLTAMSALLNQYQGTSDFIKDLAKADMLLWNDNMNEGDNEKAEAAKKVYHILSMVAIEIHQIESKFW